MGSAARKVLFLPHAISQMSRPDRILTQTEVRAVIDNGEIIEEYPEDARGHSFLLLGYGAGRRPIHLVCSPKDEYLAIITAYLPDPAEWSGGFGERRKEWNACTAKVKWSDRQLLFTSTAKAFI